MDIFQDLENFLNRGSNPQIIITGRVEKVLVGTSGKYRFIVQTRDEHNPPHFHVKTKDGSIDASYRISDFKCMEGYHDRLDKVVRAWLEAGNNKEKVANEWKRIQESLL
ncbi:MAG: DUF4160 domain-containing protein [Candidatus Moraniibacteriota bacterium]